jgi:hypothetical protein
MSLRSLRASILTGLSFALSLSATAQVARVFVSVNGNDGNTCSNVATPCRTFSGGIAQVDDGGEVIVLDSGSYGGTTITKGVTLNVAPGVVAFAAQPFTINAPGKNVTLRGLTLKALVPGTGIAVTFSAGALLTIDGCVVNGWQDGVDHTAAAQLVVRDSVFKNMALNGVLVQPASANSTAMVAGCRFENNQNVGLLAREHAQIWVRDSVFTGNHIGADAISGSSGVAAELYARNCTFVGNFDGIIIEAVGPGPLARVSGCAVIDNTNVGMGAVVSLGTFESFGDNDVRGNNFNTVGTISPVPKT